MHKSRQYCKDCYGRILLSGSQAQTGLKILDWVKESILDLLNGATLRRWLLLQQAAQNRGMETLRVAIERLPDFLLNLQRLDFFVNSEENSLLFETHAALESGPAASPAAMPTPDRPVVPAPGSGTTNLDFDNP